MAAEKSSARISRRGASAEWRIGMEEKIYKVMGGSGALNLAAGVISIVVGVTGGVLLIVSGAKLLAGRSKILF